MFSDWAEYFITDAWQNPKKFLPCFALLFYENIAYVKSLTKLAKKPLKEVHRSSLKGPIAVHLRWLLQNSPAMLSNEKQEQFGVIIVHIANVTKKGRADNCQCESLWKNLHNQDWAFGNSSGIAQPFFYSRCTGLLRHLRTSSSWIWPPAAQTAPGHLGLYQHFSCTHHFHKGGSLHNASSLAPSNFSSTAEPRLCSDVIFSIMPLSGRKAAVEGHLNVFRFT